MAKLIGAKSHVARLRKLSGTAMQAEARRLVLTLADMHKTEAQISITTGSVGGDSHVRSKEGESPNNEFGTLANNIEAALTGPLTAESSSNASYSADLEFGTSKMAERPFMRPAAKKIRAKAENLARIAVKRIVAGGTL